MRIMYINVASAATDTLHAVINLTPVNQAPFKNVDPLLAGASVYQGFSYSLCTSLTLQQFPGDWTRSSMCKIIYHNAVNDGVWSLEGLANESLGSC